MTGTLAPALLPRGEAWRTIRSEAAVTGLVGIVALRLQTQYDVYVAAPDHRLLSVRRPPETNASQCLHVTTFVATCNRCTSSHRIFFLE
jgi:hypothetical protein